MNAVVGADQPAQGPEPTSPTRRTRSGIGEHHHEPGVPGHVILELARVLS
ncbi:hypothetical protein [Nocardioides sp.]|nr:hypothetical protein [Nocardioides sp.]MBC7276780.1 hypothetical protein [Nocardioides sp.]